MLQWASIFLDHFGPRQSQVNIFILAYHWCKQRKPEHQGKGRNPMSNICSLVFGGIVLTACAIKLDNSALGLHLLTPLQVAQSQNVGTFKFHLVHQMRSRSTTRAGQASNCDSVSECPSLNGNLQQAFITSYDHSLNQEARYSTDDAISFHLIFVQSVLIFLTKSWYSSFS